MTDVVFSSVDTHDVLLFDEPAHEVITVFAGEPGPRGPAGPAGPPGPPGASAAGTGELSLHQSFVFPTPAATWIVAHGFGRIPAVSVLDTTGALMLADVEHGGLNTLSVTHSGPMAGSVHLQG